MWDRHAIQVDTINYQTLSLEVNDEIFDPEKNECTTLSMQTAITDFDEEDNLICVKLRILNGYDDDVVRLADSDFWMDIVIEGVFKVDLDKFPKDKIVAWANSNAPLILYPYAREVAYSLTNRVFKDSAAMLPLLTLPTVHNHNDK
jgi:preprotein translocase subunit SecB